MSVNPQLAITAFPGVDLKRKGFNVYEVSAPVNSSHALGRRDFYKIVLITGDMLISYGDQSIDINGTFLFFANPLVPHSVVHRSTKNKGYACVFTEAFIASRERTEMLHNSPLFRAGVTPVLPLNSEQAQFMTSLYRQMLAVHGAGYEYKDELLRSCVALIIHEALRIQPSKSALTHKNAATRITRLFMNLLEKQFPIEHTGNPLRLRTAQDFAGSLAVHVNYLNRSVKEVTGKPISVHIAERIVAEATALLQHTDWSVADIAYSLGFNYPTYFNNYFKRVAGFTPRFVRTKTV